MRYADENIASTAWTDADSSANSSAAQAVPRSRTGIQFALLILLTATLFIRPAEVVMALQGLPIYQVLMLFCLALSLPLILAQLRIPVLAGTPITTCVLGLFLAVLASHLSHGRLYDARVCGIEFAKIVLFYLLMLGLINSAARLRKFLIWLLALTVVLTALSMLEFYGVIDVPALEPVKEAQEDQVDPDTGEFIVLTRLSGAGIFGNPNDLARILVVGMIIAVYCLTDARATTARILYMVPLGIMGYALHLTHSRGGLTSLLAAAVIVFRARFGWLKTAFMLAVVIPALLTVFSGRQVQFDSESGTGATRIRLWAEGLELFRSAPIFGIGVDRLEQEIGIVAHNSYIQCFAELGFVGGVLFVGAFYLALRSLFRARAGTWIEGADQLEHSRPYILAIVAATIVGMLTSTRTYSYPTYIVLALAAVAVRLMDRSGERPVIRFDRGLAGRLLGLGAGSLAVLYIYVHAMVLW